LWGILKTRYVRLEGVTIATTFIERGLPSVLLRGSEDFKDLWDLFVETRHALSLHHPNNILTPTTCFHFFSI
jgi:hypothetical protein